MEKMPVGFIGLGHIGKPMARNLICERFEAHVYDVAQEPVEELVAAGAIGAASPAELARRCRIIGLCVRDDRDVDSLLYGAEGLLAHAAPDTVITVHSTVSQAALLKWAADAREHEIHLIDAPVTRGAMGKEPHFICYMVGGPAELLERCRPVFETSAEDIIHAGALGTGIALKLCNNLMTYLEFIAMSEAAALAERAGLSTELLRKVGETNGIVNEKMYGFIDNRSKLSAQLDRQTFEKAFGSFGKLGEKDLDAALESARAFGLALPATRLAREIINDVFLNRS